MLWNNPNWTRRAAVSIESAAGSSVTMSYSLAGGCDWGYVAAVFRSGANAIPTATASPSPTPTITPTVPAAPSGQIWRSYYFAGSQRIAMRVAGDPAPGNNGVFYLLGDHLGSTSVVVDANGNLISELRYKAWGETRYASGTTATDYRYTGQREEAGLGLYYYRARWYDPGLGRFAQADSLVPRPDVPASYDRYSYVLDNPTRFTDPSGRDRDCSPWDSACRSLVALERSFKIIVHEDSGTTAAEVFSVAMEAAELTGGALSPFLDVDSASSFETVHGPITIEIDPSAGLDAAECKVDSETNIITCGRGTPTVPTLIHEYGHVFDNRYKALVGVLASGDVPGDWVGDPGGYACGDTTCLPHPPGYGGEQWIGRHEEFANMYVNYVLNGTVFGGVVYGFSQDQFGDLRTQWMESGPWYPFYGLPVYLENMGLR